MRITKTDTVLSAIMFASLVGAHVMRANGLIFVAMLAPSFFFVFPLCQAFQKGIASARDHMRGTAAGSPWREFGKVIWPRLAHWFVLWMVYFAVLEVYLETVLGGLNWSISVSNAGLVLGTIAACFIWAPRCENLWTLVLATVLTVVPTFILFLFLGAIVLEVLDLGGYMGLGILIYSPFVASGCLFVAAIISSIWARCRGGAWFRASLEG